MLRTRSKKSIVTNDGEFNTFEPFFGAQAVISKEEEYCERYCASVLLFLK